MTIIDTGLPALVAMLSAIPDPADRLGTFCGAVRARGGAILLPSSGANHWGPHRIEVSLGGVWASGDTGDEALAEWLKCARRLAATGTTPERIHA